jgi:hypothetical protein
MRVVDWRLDDTEAKPLISPAAGFDAKAIVAHPVARRFFTGNGRRPIGE